MRIQRKKRIDCILIILLISSTVFVHAQQSFILEKQKHRGRLIQLDTSRTYHFITATDTVTGKLLRIDQHTVMIKADHDSHSNPWRINQESLEFRDTVFLKHNEIYFIKKNWFKNSRWMRFFALIAAGSLLSIPLLPAAAINKGMTGVKEWAMFEAMLLSISFPPIFIGTRQTRYNLRDKWEFRSDSIKSHDAIDDP